MKQYFLMKTEPETYSFDQLLRDKKTNWNDVRNYQARNFLKTTKLGDEVLIYHSGDERAVVGLAKVIKTAYPDMDPDGGEWVQVDIAPLHKFKKSVDLKVIKETKSLSGLMMLKQSRLSVMPITKDEYEIILELSK